MYQPCAPRKKKTDIVRKRTGCQNCRKRRRKCDEGRPDCQACVRRGVKCSGYQRALAFKDVSDQTAELSRKFEAARWAQLKEEDERRTRGSGGTRRISTTESEETSPQKSEVMGDQFILGPWETISPPFEGFDSPRGNSNASGVTSGGELTPDPSISPSAESYQSPAPRTSSDGARGHSISAHSDGSASSLNVQFEHMQGNFTDALSPSAVLFPLNEGMDMDHDRGMSVASSNLPDDTFSFVPDDVSLSSFGQESCVLDPSVQLIKRSQDQSVMNDPLAGGLLSIASDASLYTHFENTVLKQFPVPFTFRHRYVSNNCFRLAILALSSANLKGLQRHFQITIPEIAIYDEPTTRTYYLSAVRELHQQLQLPEIPDREALGAAAIILAYYEMETGTPNGQMGHARGVDAILSKLDFAKFSVPEVFKAWRLLRYDSMAMRIAYRKTSIEKDSHEIYSMLDPQLAIRDIYVNLSRLVDRWTMESCFPAAECPANSSPCGEAAKWIKSVLLRKCDFANCESEDFHQQPLTREGILAVCDRCAHWLDQWHSALDYAGLPSLNACNEAAFIKGPGFDPIPPVTFGDHKRGFEYLLYVTSRMLCNYLRSLFEPHVYSAAMTESWAKLILGISVGLDRNASMFTSISKLDMVVSAGLLTEGTAVMDAVIGGFMPHFLPHTAPDDERAHWRIYCKKLDLVRKEKARGRSIRMIVHGFDYDFERGTKPNGHKLACFGDYNGKGPIRQSYFLEWPTEKELQVREACP